MKIALSIGVKEYPFDRFKPIDIHVSADELTLKEGENVSDFCDRVYELLKVLKLEVTAKLIEDSPYIDMLSKEYKQHLSEQVDSVDGDLVDLNFEEK